MTCSLPQHTIQSTHRLPVSFTRAQPFQLARCSTAMLLCAITLPVGLRAPPQLRSSTMPLMVAPQQRRRPTLVAAAAQPTGAAAPPPPPPPPLAAAALGCLAALLLTLAPPAVGAKELVQGYPRVVDGDTLDFSGTRVRLFGIGASRGGLGVGWWCWSVPAQQGCREPPRRFLLQWPGLPGAAEAGGPGTGQRCAAKRGGSLCSSPGFSSHLVHPSRRLCCRRARDQAELHGKGGGVPVRRALQAGAGSKNRQEQGGVRAGGHCRDIAAGLGDGGAGTVKGALCVEARSARVATPASGTNTSQPSPDARQQQGGSVGVCDSSLLMQPCAPPAAPARPCRKTGTCTAASWACACCRAAWAGSPKI